MMPFPGEKQHGVKSRVVAAAHGSRRDGTVPLGGESRGDASYRGRRHGLHAGSGRLGWKWALQCAGLLVPHSPWHWHGGCRLVGTWDGFSLDASQNQPSSSCSPNVLMLCIHLGTYLGPETWDLRVSWVTALSGDTAASPALPTVRQPCHHTWEPLMLLVPYGTCRKGICSGLGSNATTGSLSGGVFNFAGGPHICKDQDSVPLLFLLNLS